MDLSVMPLNKTNATGIQLHKMPMLISAILGDVDHMLASVYFGMSKERLTNLQLYIGIESHVRSRLDAVMILKR